MSIQWNDSEDAYKQSPFYPLKQLSSRRKGAEIERVFESIMVQHGYRVQRADSSDYDRLVDGMRIEVKGSFRWSNGQFRWQQIRIDQEYDYLVVMAFHPDRVELYACSHATAKAHLTRRDSSGAWIHNQHGGRSTNSGTYFVDGQPADYPWLQPLHQVLPAPAAGKQPADEATQGT